MARFRVPKAVGHLSIVATRARTYAVSNGVRGKNKVFIPCRDIEHAREVVRRLLEAVPGAEVWLWKRIVCGTPLSNRPLQQTNATRVRSEVGDAATPRAAPAAPRGRGTLEGDLGVRCWTAGRWADERMRFSISRKIPGPDLEAALPKRYSGLTDATTRRRRQLTLLAFPDDHVVTSADAARALKRLEGKGDDVVAFMGDATTEALASLRGAGARVFTLRSFGWTDARYAAIRHPPSHERDRGPGGRPK